MRKLFVFIFVKVDTWGIKKAGVNSGRLKFISLWDFRAGVSFVRQLPQASG